MLYVVATPIGNLNNISPYALEILGSVSLIACEDTRQTHKLLSHYQITTPCISYHAHNERSVTARTLLPKLVQGEDLAIVSDAGTPGVSDPGAVLVEAAWQNDIAVCAVPGPSALTSLLSIAGKMGDARRRPGFWFEGFLPHKKGRVSRLSTLMAWNVSIIFFESPYRIGKLLQEITDIDKERMILLSSEITKIHERSIRMPAARLLAWWNELAHDKEKKGEYSVLVYYRD